MILEMRLNIYSHFLQVAEFRQLALLNSYLEFSNMISDKTKKGTFIQYTFFILSSSSFCSTNASEITWHLEVDNYSH